MPIPSPTDSDLRRFILGTATEAEAEAFTFRLLESALEEPGAASDDLLAGALAEEDDLIDEYVRGELDDEAAQRFESLVLGRPDGRRRVRFARALAERVGATAKHDVTAMTPTLADVDESEAESAEPEADRSWWRSLLASFQTPAARPAWALCLVMLMMSAVLSYRLALRTGTPTAGDEMDDGADTANVAPVTAAPATDDTLSEADPAVLARLESETEELTRRLEESRLELESLRSDLRAATATATSAAPKVVSLLLAATTRGSQVPTFDVPRDATSVEFQIDLAGRPDVPSLRVRLLDADAFQVWGRPSVEPEGETGLKALLLRTPVEVLRAGSFTLILEVEDADGTWGTFSQHEFRIARS